MIIAFPPCTYLTNAGARHLWKGHKLNEERYAKGLAAKEFFMQFYNADCDKVAIENPTPSRIYELPEKNAGNSAVSIRASVYETNTVMAERAAKVGADRHSGAGKNVLPIRQLFRQA